MRVFVRLAIALALITAAIPAQAQTTGGVRGFVRERPWDMSKPLGPAIPGATVYVVGRSATETVKTDRRGFYVIWDLPPGFYQLFADAEGYMRDAGDGWRYICIHAGNQENADLTVVPPLTVDWDYSYLAKRRNADRFRPSQTQTADLYSIGDC
jgi:hypothetical protein